MKPERWQQVERLYHQALERATEERAPFLAKACAEDEALRLEVESLLVYDEPAGHFIATPPDDIAAGLMAQAQGQSLVGRQLGAFQILSLLGAGGMGEVYRARDTKLDRTVALKTLPADLASDQDRMRRFVREAKAASALNHPNVVTIYELGEADGTGFIVMEYVEGQTLAARINGRPMDASEIVAIGIQIAGGLEEAHSKETTHGDINPGNLMLTPKGQVKVLDFGLAKVTPPIIATTVSELSQTASGAVMGTVAYMSPEQALGREVDYGTDIFSLGVVLYEMTTGRRPFSGTTSGETIDSILHRQPEALAQFNSSATPELERIVLKCLEKDREQRYQSARELLADLRQLKQATRSRGAKPALVP